MEEARQRESAWEVRLGIPQPELDKLSLASARPRRLRAWLDALPMGEPHRSAPPLLTLLDELPRLRVDGRRRLALLEEIRPRLRQLAYTLESRYLNLPLMPPERALQAAALSHRLFQGLAIGYQSVAAPLLRGKLNRPERQAAATALQRAMDARAQDLFLHMLLYKEPPAGTWQVLHNLYAEAERHALEALTVSDPELPGEEGAVLIAYGRLLLTASAQPNQLRQPALMALYRAAAHWARWMPLLADAADAPFHVDLQSDAGPQALSARADNGQALRYFDTRPLAAALAEGGPGHRSRPLSDILSHHLRWAWLGPRERRGPRRPVDGEMLLCLGLDAVHRRLDQGEGDEPLHRVRRVDHGDGGYCLEWRGGTPNTLRAGGLLALSPMEQPQWRVGEIRWVAWLGDAVRLGVALLPETLRPVRVSAGDPSAWPAPALLVPSPEGDDPETLVVPTTGYRSGTRLTLWDGPPRDTRLGVRLAGSPDIAQYTLRPAV